MPLRRAPHWSSDQSHESVACSYAAGAWAGVTSSTACVEDGSPSQPHFSGCDVRKPNARAFSTPNRAVAVPNPGWCTLKRHAGSHYRGVEESGEHYLPRPLLMIACKTAGSIPSAADAGSFLLLEAASTRLRHVWSKGGWIVFSRDCFTAALVARPSAKHLAAKSKSFASPRMSLAATTSTAAGAIAVIAFPSVPAIVFVTARSRQSGGKRAVVSSTPSMKKP